MNKQIEGFLGIGEGGRKSRIPARLDLIQSGTGLILGLFMWLHMLFVATILISQSAFDSIVHLLELRFISNSPFMSYITSFLAACVLIIFFVHAALGMRKMPINFRQWQIYRAHTARMKHEDTTLWWVQACTGFIMFFLGSAHLIIIVTNADKISADLSAQRVFSHFMWLFYLVLLFAVELHGSIGLYRLCVKWGWFEGKDAKESRKKLKKAKWFLSIFFLVLGLLSLAAFLKIGYNNYATGDWKTAQVLQINSDGVRV
ncbi:fumarate reductase cytochrome b subunit [Campylobacter hyointestinalis]|uniref:fumarate reductase cytochrome b subunit n=1 Tax=Campylobacter hyointestinalis TaxID=198 RepID=UPI000726762B|nr:fumarate reductase cytochrome b subunit [Campylobacter hyointestinalis]PPB51481.1 succinate dehydrogenase/fumarate reductase cytochrome b subunit [Campylobacter hyointestinalis subsp. hyointestinalis]PPB54731.1 succinate dehydrogenase/fumarate reductase cytochrome b subunit [Campylobacter hyointestinalis subsp. hyointestinalis]PPB60453.1 succinate dehydrogenase/fumarate reductase cytochrome b subunit [Campylobacter hyointestinalis subsp. hyointestinalis]PPB64839.1 succinate dehydrogenase/fum